VVVVGVGVEVGVEVVVVVEVEVVVVVVVVVEVVVGVEVEVEVEVVLTNSSTEGHTMATKQAAQKESILSPGAAVFIRTVTHNYTGRVVFSDDRWITLSDAAWIADSGRWAAALATGSLSEVEPFPGQVMVGVGAVVDVSPWAHSLPRETK
jgi:hypothetical protein